MFPLGTIGRDMVYNLFASRLLTFVLFTRFLTAAQLTAITVSLRPFIIKLTSALVVALTSFTCIVFGVTDFTNQISTLEQNCTQGLINESEKLSQIGTLLQGVAPGQNLGLLFVMTIVPWLLMLLSYLLYKMHYKLYEAEYERICQEIERRKAEAAV